MASAKTASTIGVRINDVGSTLKFCLGFPFGENSAGLCKCMWLPGSILNFRIGSVSSIGGLIAATLFAATISDSQIVCMKERSEHVSSAIRDGRSADPLRDPLRCRF